MLSHAFLLELLGVEKKLSHEKNLHDIIVNALAAALLKNIMEVSDSVKKYKRNKKYGTFKM